MTYSSNPSTSSDHASKSHASFSFESWIDVLSQEDFSLQDQAFFLQGLHDHSEWLNQSRYGSTALIYATSYGRIEITQALIEAGVDVNVQNQAGWSALIWSSYGGDLSIIHMLIDAGANLNHQDQTGWTALMHASHQGHEEVVQALIHAGADLNLQNQWGCTALMHASDRGHFDVVQSLIHQGVDLEIRNSFQQTALDLAKNNRRQEVLCLLEAYAFRQALSQVTHLKSSSSSENIPPIPSLKTPRL